MNTIDYLWPYQFNEMVKELARTYDYFWDSREIDNYDIAYRIHEKLNETYGLSIDFMDYVKFGRAWLRSRPSEKGICL
jgi:hypothetical protein